MDENKKGPSVGFYERALSDLLAEVRMMLYVGEEERLTRYGIRGPKLIAGEIKRRAEALAEAIEQL